jgi:hypothetical protein
LRQLLLEIYAHYSIDRGLGVILQHNLVRITSDIIESLLYCAIATKGIELQSSRNSGRASKLVQVAKSNRLISKRCADACQKLIDLRNDYHPDRQVDLHTNLDPALLEKTSATLDGLIKELRSALEPQVPSVDAARWEEEDDCQYCVFTPLGNVCPACGSLAGL